MAAFTHTSQHLSCLISLPCIPSSPPCPHLPACLLPPHPPPPACLPAYPTQHRRPCTVIKSTHPPSRGASAPVNLCLASLSPHPAPISPPACLNTASEALHSDHRRPCTVTTSTHPPPRGIFHGPLLLWTCALHPILFIPPPSLRLPAFQHSVGGVAQ